jgi:hypothetical protein
MSSKRETILFIRKYHKTTTRTKRIKKKIAKERKIKILKKETPSKKEVGQQKKNRQHRILVG